MMELEECNEELKNTLNEFSHWQSGAVKSIEVYDVDKEVSMYDIAGPSARCLGGEERREQAKL